nr:hypothetical protein [Tanacetum cinerariifolium]
PEHADDEIVAEDQPYAEDASPIVQSPEYVPESDDEMDVEADEEEEEEEHPAPADSVIRLLAISTPPASQLSPWSSPPPQIPSPPLPPILSPPSPILAPAPPPSPAAAARPAGGFRADYGFVAAADREIMRDPEREVGYGITDSWDEIVETLQGAPAADRRRQTVISEIRRSRETSESRTSLQGQITALQAQ